MPKQTRLDDNARIYQPRKEQTEKEKLRDMTLKNKILYIWDYYRVQGFITLAVLIMLGYFIYSVAVPKPEVRLSVAMINNTVDPTLLDDLSNQFATHLKLNEQKETVDINYSFHFNSTSSYAMSQRQALFTYIAASEIDVIIAPKSVFSGYAYNGYFKKLSDLIPTDLYSSLTDYFFESNQESNPKNEVYGIYLTESDFYMKAFGMDKETNEAVLEKYFSNSDPYVIGILTNSKHKENATEFIRYLFQVFP